MRWNRICRQWCAVERTVLFLKDGQREAFWEGGIWAETWKDRERDPYMCLWGEEGSRGKMENSKDREQSWQLCVRGSRSVGWSEDTQVCRTEGEQGGVAWTIGALKSLFQYHSLKASILWCSASFMVQLSHSYMTTGKTIALTRRTCVSKVMSLLLKTLSRFVIDFLPRSRCFLISWLQSPSMWFWSPRQ